MKKIMIIAIGAMVALIGTQACGMSSGVFLSNKLANISTDKWAQLEWIANDSQSHSVIVERKTEGIVSIQIKPLDRGKELNAQIFPRKDNQRGVGSLIILIPTLADEEAEALAFYLNQGDSVQQSLTFKWQNNNSDVSQSIIDANQHFLKEQTNDSRTIDGNQHLKSIAQFVNSVLQRVENINFQNATKHTPTQKNPTILKEDVFITNWIAKNKPTRNTTHKTGPSTPHSTKMPGAFDDTKGVQFPSSGSGKWAIFKNWMAENNSYDVEVAALESNKTTRITLTKENSGMLSETIFPQTSNSAKVFQIIVTPAPTDTNLTTFNVLALYSFDGFYSKWTTFEWEPGKRVDLHESLKQADDASLDDDEHRTKTSIQSNESLREIANIVTELFDAFHSRSNTLQNNPSNETSDKLIADWIAQNTSKPKDSKDKNKDTGSKTPATLSFFERHRTKIITLGIMTVAAAVGGVGYYVLGQSEAEASGDTQ